MVKFANIPNSHSGAVSPDLATTVRELIERRMGRTVTDLSVTVEWNRVMVRGRTQSFYDWQRVQTACRQALSAHPGVGLDCTMSVSYVAALDI
jgi:hypothetical protein